MTDDSTCFLDPESQRALLSLAREAIRRRLEGLEPPPPPPPGGDPRFREQHGAFVSLHRGEALRGCIGYITSDKPLFRTIIDAAVAAATADPRFPPVTPAELDGLDIEISVLTPPAEVADTSEIEVGRDGLIVSKGYYRGLLLPQVATEYGWDCDTFLEHTCTKAGLKPSAWKDAETRIERFSAQVFSEFDFGRT